MSLPDFLRKIFPPKRPQDPPDLLLGRYTDAFKTEAQERYWSEAIQQYRAGKKADACHSVLSYLRDGERRNVWWTNRNGVTTFFLQQGSQRIEGQITAEYVRAESRLAMPEHLNVGFMRRLMEYNFNLSHCRFALAPDKAVVLCFATPMAEASPVRLVLALRELALWADKQDDLLLDEFKMLKPIHTTGTPLPESEREAKYHFLQSQIRAAFALMDKGDPKPEQHPAIFAYLLLALIYRLDYLVRPEGFVMDALENTAREYYRQRDKSLHARVQTLRRELQKILERPREQVLAELYRTECTFGNTSPLPFERVVEIIERESGIQDWAINNGYETLAMAVPQYIIGYTLFYHVPPKPMYELFRLFMRVTEPEFFSALGLHTFTRPNGQMDKWAILSAMEEIITRNRAAYPKLRLRKEMLNFTSPALFGKSFLALICRLDLTQQ